MAAGAAWGCGSARSDVASPSVVLVPAPEGGTSDSGPVPSAERGPQPTDPLQYYVGEWDGVMDGRWRTLLSVKSDGGFEVQYVPRPGEDSCVMAGRLRVEDERLWLEIEVNTCEPDKGPETLERPIVEKRADGFVLRSPDGAHTYRYDRR